MIVDKEDLIIELQNKYTLLMRCISIGYSSSDTLSAHIVTYKSIGFGKDFAMLCMAELVRRRTLGEEFYFEEFIEVERNKIPKVDAKNMKSILQLIDMKSMTKDLFEKLKNEKR